LVKLIIPELVEVIGEKWFSNCESLFLCSIWNRFEIAKNCQRVFFFFWNELGWDRYFCLGWILGCNLLFLVQITFLY
jgi:hypothetical protein